MTAEAPKPDPDALPQWLADKIAANKDLKRVLWLWPLLPFWTYTPWGYAAAILWNVCELARLRVPFAHVVFGLIIGRKGKACP